MELFQRAMGFVHRLKLLAWTTFLFVFPPLCLLRGMAFGAALTGALGVVLATLALREHPKLRFAMGVEGLVVASVGIFWLVRPMRDWHVDPATGELGELTLALGPQGEVAALDVREASASLHVRTGSGWSEEAYPGAVTFTLVADGSLLWGAPRDGRELLVRTPGSSHDGAASGPTWRRLPSPNGYVRSFAVSDVGPLAVIGGQVYEIDRLAFALKHRSELGRMTTICASALQVLAVRELPADVEVWRSDDGGKTFIEEQKLEGGASDCALSKDGWAWVADGGLLRGRLSVRAPGATFARRDLPASDVRAIAVNPSNGSEAWIATWGAGVFRSRDGGTTWADMGLHGVEVRSLAVDFQSGVAWAASANLIGRHGLWTRRFLRE